jgi:hypothetical protein
VVEGRIAAVDAIAETLRANDIRADFEPSLKCALKKGLPFAALRGRLHSIFWLARSS